MEPRPGFGLPHEDFLALLARRRTASIEDVSWSNGAVRFRVAVHLTPAAEVPDELVTSARCIVRVDEHVLLCTNADEADGLSHVLPGGRREYGETPADAAVREVHEETGWHLDRVTIHDIGWLHFSYQTPVDPEFQHYPHPDFVHAVFTAQATERDGAQGGDWSDTEGYVVSSRLVSTDEARTAVAGLALDRVLLERAIDRR